MISIRIDMDPATRNIKIDNLSKQDVPPQDLAVIFSQVTTALLINDAQQRQLIINPMAPIVGVKKT
jgi:hypothetical protein